MKCPKCGHMRVKILNRTDLPNYRCLKCLYFFDEKEEFDTSKKIDELFNNFKEFLLEKNLRYGDAALNPINIFSKVNPESQICNRLDDKLSRIKNSTELKKNDVCDIFGYIALLMISNNWLEFEDLLD